MSQDTQYAWIADSLAALKLQHSAAGWHGLLCGALCVDDAEHIDSTHLADGDAPAIEDKAALQALQSIREESSTGLSEAGVAFTLLLPDDETSLHDRAQALADWCEGFLFSLSGRHKLELENYSNDVQEIVHDFSELTRATFADDDDDPEEEENAYVELVEYVRVGAQLVFVELRRKQAPPRAKSKNSPTLH